jgi:hypothetical protein
MGKKVSGTQQGAAATRKTQAGPNRTQGERARAGDGQKATRPIGRQTRQRGERERGKTNILPHYTQDSANRRNERDGRREDREKNNNHSTPKPTTNQERLEKQASEQTKKNTKAVAWRLFFLLLCFVALVFTKPQSVCLSGLLCLCSVVVLLSLVVLSSVVV